METINQRIKKNLPRENYIDPDIFLKEQELIFYKSWLMAGHPDQILNPGDYFIFNVLDQSIIIIRDTKGEVQGFYNVCPHRGHELISDKQGNKQTIQCPYHAWVFENDGALKTARGLERKDFFDKKSVCLSAVRVEIFCGMIFINLEESAKPMGTIYPGVEDAFRKVAPRFEQNAFSWQHTKLLNANWKVAVENYSECYHCPSAHTMLENVVDFKSIKATPKANCILHTAHAQPQGKQGYNINHEVEHETQYLSYYLWPLTAIQIYPGNLVNSYHWIPVDVDHTIVHRSWFFENKVPTPEQMAIIETDRNNTFAEDVSIVEAVQRGLKNRGYKPGPIVMGKNGFGTLFSEDAVFAVQQMVLNALGNNR